MSNPLQVKMKAKKDIQIKGHQTALLPASSLLKQPDFNYFYEKRYSLMAANFMMGNLISMGFCIISTSA